jgi:hypothetical protein
VRLPLRLLGKAETVVAFAVAKIEMRLRLFKVQKRAPGVKPGATFLRRDLDYELAVFRVVPREDR